MRVITLSGSTRFKDEFERQNRELTLEGHVVLMPACLWHQDGEVPNAQQRMTLSAVYNKKIELAQELFVLNVGGYIGEETAREIRYALALGKAVRFLEPVTRVPVEVS